MHHDGQGHSALDLSELDDKLRLVYERNAEILRAFQGRNKADRGSQDRGRGDRGFRGKRGRGGWGRPYGGDAPAAAAEKTSGEAKLGFRHVEGATSTLK